MDKKTELQLKAISNHLIVNASNLCNLGLFHGKMGIVLFFVHYARYTGNNLYQDYAGELLDEIFEDIHAGTTLDFENGLSGIGWGILYLLKNHFMEGNPDEILIDIDQKMKEINYSNVKNKSIERGLKGYLYYLKERLQFISNHSLFNIVEFQNYFSSTKLDNSFNLGCLVEIKNEILTNDIKDDSLGIRNGYAGYGLKLMKVL